jgi:hypothetical protein
LTRRRRLLAALPLAAALPVLLAGPAPTALTAPASTSADRALTQRVFGKAPGAHELLDRVQRDFLPVGATNQAFDAVGATLTAVGAAGSLPTTGPAWSFAGPKKGYYLKEGYETAPAHYGHSSGIVPTMAADPSDTTGNTLYIGTHGGLFRTTDGGRTWTDLTLGKLPRLGIGAVAVDPADPNRLYIGTGVPLLTRSDDAAGTGLYVSNDRGRTWQRGRYTGHGYGVSALAVSPTAVFAATADGLYRSTDHGGSWTRVPLKSNAAHTAEYAGKYGNFITDVAVQPGNPSHVVAAVGYGSGKLRMEDGSLASEGNGLYTSTDGGATFSYDAATSQLTNPTVSSDPIGFITLHFSSAPGYGNVLYAIVGDAGKNRGACEGGASDPGLTDPVVGLNLVGALCASVINGIYRSLDGGATWSLLANYETLLGAPGSQLTLLTALGIGPGYQAGYNKYIADDPTDPTRVVFGLEETYAVRLPAVDVALPSTGITPSALQVINKYWDTVGVLEPGTGGTPAGLPYYGGITTTHPDQHIGLFVKTAAGSRLYAGNDGGVWSQDTGLVVTGQNTGATDLSTCQVPKATTGLSNCDWASLNDLPTVLPYHANMKPDGVIVAGLQDNGTILVDKAGNGVNVCGGDGVQVGVTKNPDVFYCSTPNQGIQATTDGGKTLDSIYLDGDQLIGGDGLAAYAVDPTDGNHLLRAGRNVLITVDGPNSGASTSKGFVQVFDAGSSGVKTISGSTFDWAASGMTVRGSNAYVAFCPGVACRGVVTKVNQNQQLIATNVKAGCKNAKQSAACWHKVVPQGLGFGQLVGLAIDPQDARTVYASMNTYNFIGLDPTTTNRGKVFVSHDAGAHFTDITANLPKAGANNVVLVGRRLFVATEVGAFTKLTTDRQWTRLGAGLPAVPVRDLQADLSGKHLTASLFGRGVWTLGTAGLSGITTGSGAGASAPGGGRPATGSLAATGLPAGLAGAAALLIGLGLISRRRLRA